LLNTPQFYLEFRFYLFITIVQYYSPLSNTYKEPTVVRRA